MKEIYPLLQIPQQLQALIAGVYWHTYRHQLGQVKALLASKETANVELALALIYSLELPVERIVLTYYKLEEVPSYLPLLTKTKYLELSHNSFKKEELSFLKDFDQLERLYLNNIDSEGEIPDYLNGLEHLEILSWWKGEIETLPIWLSQLPKLKKLLLAHNNIKIIPEAILEMPSLEDLNLSNSIENLEQFPLDHNGTSNLKVLNLSNSHLSKQGHAIKAILTYKKLEELYLKNCRLSLLQDGWEELKHLKILDLNGNTLKRLPKSLRQLDQLESLSLGSGHYSNKMKLKLPIQVGDWSNLKHLRLEKIELAYLPDILFKLPKLEELELINIGVARGKISDKLKCNIVHLDGLERLKSLKKLMLRNYTAAYLPTEIQALKQLEVLSLLNLSKLKALPQWITTLPNLRQIEIKSCSDFIVLPDGLGEMPSLEVVEVGKYSKHFLGFSDDFPKEKIGGYSWEEVKPNTKTLDFSYFPLDTFPKHIFRLETVDTLVLSNNSHLDWDTELPKLAAIKEVRYKVNLSDNQFSSKVLEAIPYYIPRDVHRLDLSNNNIEKLPLSFHRMGGNYRLSLDLSKNQRLDIPHLISHFKKNIYDLRLDNMGWSELPQNLADIELSGLSLNGNPNLDVDAVEALIRALEDECEVSVFGLPLNSFFNWEEAEEFDLENPIKLEEADKAFDLVSRFKNIDVLSVDGTFKDLGGYDFSHVKQFNYGYGVNQESFVNLLSSSELSNLELLKLEFYSSQDGFFNLETVPKIQLSTKQVHLKYSSYSALGSEDAIQFFKTYMPTVELYLNSKKV